ncbi:unnamed protein product [Hapterophycus canaliculatus]
MAHQKMVMETQHILSRCHTDDAIVVVGSDVKLRLDILAIDEELDNALLNHDPNDPSKHFERLLERFDILRKSLANADKSIVTDKWPEMRAAIAALSCLLAEQRKHTGPGLFDWGTVTTKAYIRVVDRLIPQVDMDLDALDDEEQMSASKERRNLTDVFLEKRRGVSSLKLRTLLKENKLSTFEKDMKAFTRALDRAMLPRPKLLRLYSGSGDFEESSDVEMVHVTDLRHPGHQGSPSKSSMESQVEPSAENNACSGVPSKQEEPPSAQALAKASDGLQRQLKGRPGAVTEALAIGEGLPPPRSPAAKRAAVEADGGGPISKRPKPAKATPRRSARSVTRRESLGEQVDFDDSQSLDEPHDARLTLGGRATPDKAAALASTGRKAGAKKNGHRARVPWTEEEVKHLNAAVLALGKGKWALALAQYKFQDCRTAVDLKDKWRNLTKG